MNESKCKMTVNDRYMYLQKEIKLKLSYKYMLFTKKRNKHI